MIDCSHANSGKDHARQRGVLTDVVVQIKAGNRSIRGLMVESNLHAGNQSLPDDPAQLRYGVSITDACLDWETTAEMLRAASAELARPGPPAARSRRR